MAATTSSSSGSSSSVVGLEDAAAVRCRRFLRVAEQLDALQQPTTTTTMTAVTRPRRELLPSRARIHELLASHGRLVPWVEAQRQSRPATDTNATHKASEEPAPPPPPPPSQAQAQPPAATTGNVTAAPAAASLYVPVGGRARVLPAADLARIKRRLQRRSHRVINQLQQQQLASRGVGSGSGSGSPWDALVPAAGGLGGAGKQALIAELVRRTRFSTEHIFHLSRKFKELARRRRGLALVELRQLLAEDLGAVLPPSPAPPASDSGDPTPAELRAVGATIAATESFLRRLFQALDVDGDGVLDFREFVVGLDAFARGSIEAKATALFAAFAPTPPTPRPRSSSSSAAHAPRRLCSADAMAAIIGGESELAREMRDDSDDDCDDDDDDEGEGPDDTRQRQRPPTTATTVAISDLLGLFQGDPQLYQELLHCVDEYFARTSSNAGLDAVGDVLILREDDFVAASVAEPRLLETLGRPDPSPQFAERPELRELLRAFAERSRLTWPGLLGLLRAVLASVAADGADERLPLHQPQPQPLVVTTTATSSTSTALTISVARLHELLRAHVSAAAAVAVVATTSTDEAHEQQQTQQAPCSWDDLAQRLVRSYGVAGRSGGTVAVAAGGALLQDLATVLHQSLSATEAPGDAAARARFYFGRFDQNHDGALTRAELVGAVGAGFAHFGPHVTEVVRVLEEHDRDRDGELTRDEYVAAARRSPLILASLYTCPPRELLGPTGGGGGGGISGPHWI